MPETSSWLDVAARAADVQATAAELAEMLELRRRLAEAEIRNDVFAVRRFAISAGLAAGMAGIGTAVVVQSSLLQLEAALQLDGHWLSIASGGGLLVLAALLAWLSFRRLRRDWNGLSNSLAELREDLAWLREWSPLHGADHPPDETATRSATVPTE